MLPELSHNEEERENPARTWGRGGGCVPAQPPSWLVVAARLL